MEATSVGSDEVKTALINELGKRGRKAQFVSEVLFFIGRKGIAATDLNRVMRELEDQGVILVRDHFCADPHLADADLRVVGLVEQSTDFDGTSQAVQNIEAVWQDWLASYLANHRCG